MPHRATTRTVRGGRRRTPSIWPAVEERVLDLIEAHRSTIVFTNSRRGWPSGSARGSTRSAYERATATSRRRPRRRARRAAMPAEIMAQAGGADGAPPVVARAHHGSVSREERKQIEEALKSGRLPAVVATSSLELGIDMGAVDLVVQIEAPPSVAAGLQRIGRAGHQVGAVSRGVVFPKHRGDLVACAVVAERMGDGAIEELRYPRNPLDVLAQQIVAMVALDAWQVDDLAALVRRAAPFAELPDSALRRRAGHAVRPLSRPTSSPSCGRAWCGTASTDTLTGRPGAQRLAVTSGGTIPDRGMFGVFLAGSERASRVGELDEEMVYESRVGDVFLLGSTSWRIEDITPRPGAGLPGARRPGPDAVLEGRRARPAGRAGPGDRRVRPRADPRPTTRRPRRAAARRAGRVGGRQPGGVPARAARGDPAPARRPDHRGRAVPRRARRLADRPSTRVSARGCNAPWALAIAAPAARAVRRRRRRSMPSDDGIVVRLPDTAEEPPGADLVALRPGGDRAQLVDESGGRVGAVRLPVPRVRGPGAAAAAPRPAPPHAAVAAAAALRAAARRWPASTPTSRSTLEAVRECLQDVFDVPGLVGLMREVAGAQGARRRGRDAAAVAVRPVAAVRLRRRVPLRGRLARWPSAGPPRWPWTRRCSASCSAGPTCASCSTRRWSPRSRRELQRLTAAAPAARRRGRRPTCCACSATCPPTEAGRARRRPRRGSASSARPRGARSGSGSPARSGGSASRTPAGCATRSASPLPVGVPEAFTRAGRRPARRPGRPVRPHPRAVRRGDCAARFGLGVAVVEQALQAAPRDRAGWSSGEFRPGGAGTEWCDAEVLRLLRRRSLAALRQEVEPVPTAALAAFLPRWQHDRRQRSRRRRRGCRRSSSCRAAPVPGLGAGAAGAAGPGAPTTPPRCSTSSPAAARCCGPGTARCPAATAG